MTTATPQRDPSPLIHRVLVGVDGTDPSIAAADWAATLAQRLHAEVVLMDALTRPYSEIAPPVDNAIRRSEQAHVAHDVAGASVTTVAGLAAAGELSPLQAAFVAHDALQCGFCTSGMLISATALLQRKQGAKLEAGEVRDAIAGNLCRCGTYPHVVEAVLSVANGSDTRLVPTERIAVGTREARVPPGGPSRVPPAGEGGGAR